MTSLTFLSGPPCAATLWDGVRARLLDTHGVQSEALDLFASDDGDASMDALVAQVVAAMGGRGEDHVLVAHGTAVPIAWRAAAAVDPAGLVLSNGPITGLDPILSALAHAARSPRLLASTVLKPRILQGWLASSAGLRRTVVNPYVMDRDTVVRLSDPILETQERRERVACYLRELARLPDVPPRWEGRALLVWGDADPLYGAQLVDEARRWLPALEHITVPGGQHFHPVERPWFMADALAAWLSGDAVEPGSQAAAG